MKSNFFYEIPERLANKDNFELLCEMLRESEIDLLKELVDFEKYICDQHNNGAIEPDMELKLTYERKEELDTALYKYRMCTIRMEYYLEASPYAMIGDYKECDEIYDKRYGKVDHPSNKIERQYNELKSAS